MAIALPKMKKKNKICFGNCSSVIAENGKKKNCFGNCGNDIAENGGKKKRCYEICERVKKNVVMSTIFLQHFHNKSHMISYY